jgi:AcrR family transcriptional regulator
MATTAADTRTRILDTAWRLVGERGVDDVTIAQIAAASGVSRQLIYVRFDGRAGLLSAMARHHDERSGFRRRMLDTRRLEPVERLEAMLRAWCDYVPVILPVGRALEAALATGAEGGGAWRERMDDLWEALRGSVGRVARAGRLVPGWTRDSATDWIFARLQLSVWEVLVVERGWSPEEFVERHVASIMAEVVTAAGPTSARPS